MVASAILACTERPHRTLRVGGGSKMFTMTEKMAPGLADRIKMPHFEGQHSDQPPRNDDTLWAPRPGDGQLRGNYPGHVMKSSAYTAMAKRPALSALGTAAIAVGLGLAARTLLAD